MLLQDGTHRVIDIASVYDTDKRVHIKVSLLDDAKAELVISPIDNYDAPKMFMTSPDDDPYECLNYLVSYLFYNTYGECESNNNLRTLFGQIACSLNNLPYLISRYKPVYTRRFERLVFDFRMNGLIKGGTYEIRI